MLQDINLGTLPGDKTGTPARVAGQMINDNFHYLEGKINNINYLSFDAGYSLASNILTMNSGWVWTIEGVVYTNPVAVNIPIPLASSGRSRIDLIVCNTSNTFTRVAGVESLSTPISPVIPADTILALFYVVDPATIGVPVIPKPKWAVSQQLRDGEITFAPSENVVFDALALKLDTSAYNQYFKGKYTTSEGLIAAHPTATDGAYAVVDAGTGVDAKEWIWDNEAGWIVGGATGASTTDALPEGSINLYWTVSRFLANLTYANVISALGFTPSTAPNDAQKNSNITKEEIEAKLIGEITTHTHPAVGGGGDMVLASIQDVSGLKTFLAGKFGLRNVANTFTSFFTNSNTASRTYTLQNRDGTLLDNTDLSTINSSISGKMATPTGGIASYLPKFLTATTMGLSRLWDTGTFLGIGSVYSPTKDLTFGNQANREIGIEESANSSIGRDLLIRAGRTINFVYNSNFNPLLQTSRTWKAIAGHPNGNVYATLQDGSIYMQIASTGNFSYLTGVPGFCRGIAVTPSGNVYATVQGGSIYMQTAGAGTFNTLSQTTRTWGAIAAAPNGNVYAVVYSGDIYMQTAGTGNFNPLSQTSRTWKGIGVAANGNVYAVVESGDIYMQTAGTGNFNPLSQTSRLWVSITSTPSNGNVYAVVEGGGMYIQAAGTGNFIFSSQPSVNWQGIGVSSNGNVYAVEYNGDIYMQANDVVGISNLDGGTLKHVAGTGKGTGKSRCEVWTGQKTVSGTDMQIETVRLRIDEEGNVMLMTSKVFADNAAAIAGGLPLKTIYWTATGEMRMVV